MEITKEYASKGVAGTGLGLGIAGTALGLMNGAGWLGNFANGMRTVSGAGCVGSDLAAAMMAAGMARGCTPCPEYVTQREMDLQQQLAAKDSMIALRDANTYGDQKMLEMYKYIDGRFREFEATLGAQAVQNQATKDSFQLVQQQQICDKQELMGAICRERDERKCADNTIVNYVNATFYPKMVADVTTGTATTAQTTYNPLPVSTCGCKC